MFRQNPNWVVVPERGLAKRRVPEQPKSMSHSCLVCPTVEHFESSRTCCSHTAERKYGCLLTVSVGKRIQLRRALAIEQRLDQIEYVTEGLGPEQPVHSVALGMSISTQEGLASLRARQRSLRARCEAQHHPFANRIVAGTTVAQDCDGGHRVEIRNRLATRSAVLVDRRVVSCESDRLLIAIATRVATRDRA